MHRKIFRDTLLVTTEDEFVDVQAIDIVWYKKINDNKLLNFRYTPSEHEKFAEKNIKFSIAERYKIDEEFITVKEEKPDYIFSVPESLLKHHESEQASTLSYLSYETQTHILSQAYNQFETALKTLFPYKETAVTLRDLKKEFDPALPLEDFTCVICQIIWHDIVQERNNLLSQLDAEKLTYNNINLIDFLTYVKSIFQESELILKDLKKSYKTISEKTIKAEKIFSEATQFCDSLNQQLQKMVDIQIYQVIVPKSELKGMEQFPVEGRLISATKNMQGVGMKIGGTALSVGETVVRIPIRAAWYTFVVGVFIVSPIVAAFLMMKDEHIEKLQEEKYSTTVYKNGEAVLTKNKSKMGFAYRKNIPAECIATRITPEGEIGNPNFNPPTDEETVQLYMLHGGCDNQIFENGSHYYGLDGKEINSKGKVLLFSSQQLAALCLASRLDGATHHPVLGWRIRNPWTEQERQAADKIPHQKMDLIREGIGKLTQPNQYSFFRRAYMPDPIIKTIMEYCEVESHLSL